MPERFSASVAGRHMSCHASANLDLAIPNWVAPVEDRTIDNAANRGSNMHLFFKNIAELPVKDMRGLISALEYVADLRSTRRFKVLAEVSMEATWLVGKPKTTADLVLYTQDEMHVIDLKTGKIPVEVVNNEQLLYGAATYGQLAPRAKGVTCHILQPWADGNQSWFADTATIAKFMNDAIATEAAINAGSVTFGPSDHCKFCPANPHTRGAKGSPLCPAMMQMLYPQVVDTDEMLAL